MTRLAILRSFSWLVVILFSNLSFAQTSVCKLEIVDVNQFPDVIIQGTPYNFTCDIVNTGDAALEGGVSIALMMSVNGDAGQALSNFILPYRLAPNDTFHATINNYQFQADRFGGGGGPINDITLWPPVLSVPSILVDSFSIDNVSFVDAAAFAVQNRTVMGLPNVMSFNKQYSIEVVAKNVGIEANTNNVEFYAQINNFPSKLLGTLNVTVPVGATTSNTTNFFKLSTIFQDISSQLNFSNHPSLYIWAIEKNKNNVVSRARFTIETEVFPVVLHSFSALPNFEKHLNRVEWITYSEDDNKEFVLQKWNEFTQTYETIAIKKGAGTTNETKTYTINDFQPKNGENRYQLIQYDLDGGHENLGETIVNYHSPEQSLEIFNVYPNPATEKLVLSLYHQTERTIRVQLFDIQGKCIKFLNYQHLTGTQNLEIPVSDLTEGIYFYQISNGIDNIKGQFGKVK